MTYVGGKFRLIKARQWREFFLLIKKEEVNVIQTDVLLIISSMTQLLSHTFAHLKGPSFKSLSVKEDYDYLWAVHSFDVEIFEFSVVLFLLLSSECGVSFYLGPARVNFDSSLFWNCIFTTEKNCRAGISNFNNNEFHEPLEIKCRFQWPSSSDSPLKIFCISQMVSDFRKSVWSVPSISVAVLV